MKKIFTLTILFSATLGANAQGIYYPLSDQSTFMEMMRSVVILLMVYLVTTFILNMIKLFLDNALKRKIVETGTSGDVVSQLIPVNKNDSKNSLRWFCTLGTMAIGLAVIGFYHPSEVYTMMIIAFSLAIGFLAYFFITSRMPK